MTLGLIARADNGGIAAQSWEMARWTGPAKILLVDLGAKGRGAFHPERFETLARDRRLCGVPTTEDLEWLCEGVDCIYIVEAPYNDALPELAAKRGVRVVFHANPELWDDRYRAATTEIVLPTFWEAHRVKGAKVMPMPVARDRIPFRERTEAKRFLFSAAPAMEDRNGERLVIAALRLVKSRVTFVMAGKGRGRGSRAGNVTMEFAPEREDYWSVYDTADVLVLPRRYGGLCLPIQEAAAAGMPVITLDLPPYNAFLHDSGLVPCAVDRHGFPMKGGAFDVHGCHPKALADTIDRLARNPALVTEMSRASDAWAETIAWPMWQGAWRRKLSA